MSGDAIAAAADRAPSPEEQAIDGDLRRALTGALGTLTEADREMLRGNARPALGVSAAAWRKRRQRALERLRAIWRSQDA